MIAKLTFFKPSGKYYAEGDYEFRHGVAYWDRLAALRAMHANDDLPGVYGASEFHVLVTWDHDDVPALIPARPKCNRC